MINHRRSILIAGLTIAVVAVCGHTGAADTNWWDGGAGTLLNDPANWNGSADGTGADPASINGSDAVISVNGFAGTLPSSLTNVSLNSIFFNTQYVGAVSVSAAAPQTLTLTSKPIVINSNAASVSFGSNITIRATNGGTVEIAGGSGGLSIGGSLDRNANAKWTSFLGFLSLGRFSGNRVDPKLVGTGALTLIGANSDLDGTPDIRSNLTVNLAGAGDAMFDDRNVTVQESATLRLQANHQLHDSRSLTINGNGLFDVNGYTERIGSVKGNGSLALSGGALIAAADFTGAADLQGGILTFAGSTRVIGTLDVNGGKVTFTGSTWLGARVSDAAGGGIVEKTGTGPMNLIASNVWNSPIAWEAGNGTINLNATNSLLADVVVRSANVLGFNRDNALGGYAITIETFGRMNIGGTVSNINSAIATYPYAAITGKTNVLTSAQIGALSVKTILTSDPHQAFPGMPVSNFIAALSGDLDLSSDYVTDPTGLNGPGYLGIAAAGANRSVRDSDGSGDMLSYWHSLSLAATVGNTLTTDVPITNADGAAPITIGGTGTVLFETNNLFTGTINIDDSTHLRIDCDPDHDLLPDLGALGHPSNDINMDAGATLAFRQVGSAWSNVPGILDMGARTVHMTTVVDPTIDVGSELDVQIQPGGLTSDGGGLTKAGSGRLTLLGANPGYNAQTTVVAGGVLELQAADALNNMGVDVEAGAVCGMKFAVTQADVDRIRIDSTGIMGVEHAIVTSDLDLSAFAIDTTGPGGVTDGVPDQATLFIGTTSTGGITGTITGAQVDTNADGVLDIGAIHLGGGGGTLTVTSDLKDAGGLPTDLVGSGSGSSPGVVILTGTNFLAGRVIPNQTTFLFATTSSLPNIGDIEVGPGSVPTIPGNVRLTPLSMSQFMDAGSISPNFVLLDGGQVAWHDPTETATKTLTNVNQVGQYFAGAGTPDQVILGLGAPLANVDMEMDFALSDWDHDSNPTTTNVPVRLVKKGSLSALDMTGHAHSYSGGTDIAAGTVVIDQNGLGASNAGDVVISRSAGLVVTTNVAFGKSLWSKDGLNYRLGNNPDPMAHVVIPTGSTLTVNAPLKAITTDSPFRIEGGGTLHMDTASEPAGGTEDRWSLYIMDGSAVSVDQQPRSNSKYAPSLTFAGRGGTLHMRVDGGVPIAESGGGHGWQALTVEEGAVATIDVEAGMKAACTGRTIHRIFGTVIKTGPGDMYICGHMNAQDGPIGTGTIDIRQGRLTVAGSSPYYGWQGHRYYLPEGSALRIQGGGTLEISEKFGVINSTLVINDLANPSNAFINMSGPNTISGNGDTTWNTTLEKTGATLSINRNGGLVQVGPAASLLISSGTLSVGGSVDIFTDTATPTKHVNVENGGLLTITTNAKHIAVLSGIGTTTVDGDAALAVDAFMPGASIGTMNILNSGVLTWNGAGLKASNFEIDPDAGAHDTLKVVGPLVLDSSGGAIQLDLSVTNPVAPHAGDLFGIEIVNATTIVGFEGADFTLDPSPQLSSLTRVVKGPGSTGGESLYVSAEAARPVSLASVDLQDTNIYITISITNPPDWFAVQRTFDLPSNAWDTVTSIWVSTPETVWQGTVDTNWPRVFYRLMRE